MAQLKDRLSSETTRFDQVYGDAYRGETKENIYTPLERQELPEGLVEKNGGYWFADEGEEDGGYYVNYTPPALPQATKRKGK